MIWKTEKELGFDFSTGADLGEYQGNTPGYSEWIGTGEWDELMGWLIVKKGKVYLALPSALMSYFGTEPLHRLATCLGDF